MVGLTWPKWNAIKQELIAWYEVLKEIPLELLPLRNGTESVVMFLCIMSL